MHSDESPENAKNPSRKWLQDGLNYALECVNLFDIKGFRVKKQVADFLSKSTTLFGWGGGIRTHAYSSQSAVSYRLTTPQYFYLININLQEKVLADLLNGVDSRIRTDGLQCHKLAL